MIASIWGALSKIVDAKEDMSRMVEFGANTCSTGDSTVSEVLKFHPAVPVYVGNKYTVDDLGQHS